MSSSKQLCPECSYPHCYIGLSVIECWNIDCKFYSEKQHKILLDRKKRNGNPPDVDYDIGDLYNSNNYYKPKPVTDKDHVIQKNIDDLIKDYLGYGP